MRSQAKGVPGVRWIAGTAERLRLPEGGANGVVCVLALHHFSDAKAALSEMRRVADGGRIVFLTFDPRVAEPFWFAEYFPDLWRDAYETFPRLDAAIELIAEITGQRVEVSTFRLPYLRDKFAAAGWRRPRM
jgi:ubiquinone/menaquinone biosynthesis C-methylase UbiE